MPSFRLIFITVSTALNFITFRPTYALLLVLLIACTVRDSDLENVLSERLKQFRNSKAPSMDLTEVLGKNWRKVCVQAPYGEDAESFNMYSGENVNNLLDITDNEYAVWVFYNDGAVRAAILNINIFSFGAYKSKDGIPNICTSVNNPNLYIFDYKGIRKSYFYFKHQ